MPAAGASGDGLRPQSYGPHCDHKRCPWLVCDETGGVAIPCAGQETCPMCGPKGPAWQHLAPALLAQMVEEYGSADPYELLAGEAPASVVNQAALLAQHYPRGRWVGKLATQVTGRSAELQRLFVRDYLAVAEGRPPTSGQDWSGGLSGISSAMLAEVVLDLVRSAADGCSDLVDRLGRLGVGERGRQAVEDMTQQRYLVCVDGRYRVAAGDAAG